MSDTWFISDTHFGHKNILEYEPEARPFACLEEMHEVMIDRWNSVVGKYDKVFHLGDFCFGRENINIAGRLKGQKRLIMGNHDVYGAAEYLKYFLSVHGVMFWNAAIMMHVPAYSQCAMDFIIHGHLHSRKLNDWRYINVSVEQNNLTPINADVILKYMAKYDCG